MTIESGKRVVLRDTNFTQVAMSSASANLDFASIAAGLTEDLTIALVGAVVGDVVIAGGPVLAAGLSYSAFVSAADVVTVRLVNNTAGAVDAAAADWNVAVIAAG